MGYLRGRPHAQTKRHAYTQRRLRRFSSIEAAYQEASVSWVYGGIHYRDGVEEGTKQGEKVGQWVLTKLLESR